MAKLSDITVNIGVSITQETAERCLELLSMYLTDHPELYVRTKTIDIGDRYIRKIMFNTLEEYGDD